VGRVGVAYGLDLLLREVGHGLSGWTSLSSAATRAAHGPGEIADPLEVDGCMAPTISRKSTASRTSSRPRSPSERMVGRLAMEERPAWYQALDAGAAVFVSGKQAVKVAPCLGTLSIKSRPR
jgi:hypothetical protein